ncbi:TPA: hypothetical protein LCO34_002475 [Acinetobacter baumannii]|uniref:Uncharacterized protein n=5 Tax=Acinetobacter calcoaceticus/baumannii complex TaxID=909768 RepID=A0A654L1P5_ACIBM|nr:hypothetical protein [Acinetobacter baumannii]AEP07308.1 hypothetical protein ABZJ_02848 [Acinetobacter baumannii MDR-ZJ06]AGQ07000.1 hypothetical protein BJAB0715_02354 [Acinetobacter baumannii BJAB0715]AMN01968.1 hypothetical protein AZE33_12390 [Acinetobacter baumannii]EHU1236956.1 hypothetical protein [Acinetobacter baumannii]EHU1845216.1 hypothetical protein [Acinetobacter baumannii]
MSQWKRNFRRQLAKQNAVKNQLVANESQSIQGVPVKLKKRWIVENWRSGWLWLSNWILLVIAWVGYNGVPPEIIALIPEANRENVIPFLSALGVVFRFIDQNRKKPLPPASDTFKEDV